MAKVRFDEADQEVYDLMESVIRDHFPEIAAVEPSLKITVLMASNDGEVFEPCLKLHGAACVAMIQKTKPEEKAQGGPDVRIKIDLNRWDESSERRRAAILAHELRHVEFKREKDGSIKRDAYDRPVVRFCPDDWTLTGFADVIEWYGEDAVEYQSANDVAGRIVQLGLSFMGADDMTQPGRRSHGHKAAALSASAAN